MNILRALFKKSPCQAMREFVDGYDMKTVDRFCEKASTKKDGNVKEIKLIVPDNAIVGTITLVSEKSDDGNVYIKASVFLTDGSDVEIKWD